MAGPQKPVASDSGGGQSSNDGSGLVNTIKSIASSWSAHKDSKKDNDEADASEEAHKAQQRDAQQRVALDMLNEK